MQGFAPIWALGCMSGTSLDGVDVAAIRTDGETIAEFGASAGLSYNDADRETLRAALGLWPEGDAGRLALAEDVIHRRHAEVIAPLRDGIDVLGFHGQTLNHDPKNHRTFQIGDGVRLARETGLKTVWDFRTLDMEHGGQGAPLAPFFHFACAKHIGAERPVAFLNLGGVANITYVDPSKSNPEDDGALLAFDTGPANAMIDDFVKQRTGAPYDMDGQLAHAGRTKQGIVNTFLERKFFSTKPPKSLDRNDFAFLLKEVEDLSTEDGVATLTAATILSVVHAAQWLPKPVRRGLVTGGGRKNQTIMRGLNAAAPFLVEPVEAVGLDGDMLEAQAFAFLAVRHLRGLPTSAPMTTGVKAPVSGGRIADP